MEFLGPIAIFCTWHLVILSIGFAIGHYRPWQWRIIRPPAGNYQNAAAHLPGGNHSAQYEEDDVFARTR